MFESRYPIFRITSSEQNRKRQFTNSNILLTYMEEGIMSKRFQTIFVLAVAVCILGAVAFAGGSTQANWLLRTDTTNFVPVTTGSIVAVKQVIQNLTLNSFTGATLTSTTNTTQLSTAARYYPTSGTVGLWPSQSTPDTSRYLQYAVNPITGTSFTVDSISLCTGDNIGGSGVKVFTYYYVGTDTTNFYSKATLLGSSFCYGSTCLNQIYSALSISVPSGQNLYLRLYPVSPTTRASGKYFEVSNLTIAGSTSPAIAAGYPVVTTTAVSYISTTYFTTGGKVWADSGAAVTTRGVCWSTSSPAVLGSGNYTSDSTGTGSFTSLVTGLTAGSTYYVRSYATNSKGTSYGSEVTATTYAAVVVPTVTTNTVTSIGVKTALSGGKIIDWGGADVTAKGICWSTSANPTLSDTYTVDGTGIAAFTRSMSGLSATTPYHVRAYATNSAGTGYGGDTTFTTISAAKDSTVIVAKDGSGNYTTVGAALRNVPASYTGKWTIYVKKGIYYERDTVLATSYNVNLVGEDRDSTVITNQVYSDDPLISKAGTSSTYTFLVLGYDFVAKNITIQNTYWPNKWGTTSNTQAVALMTNGGDRHEFINCVLRGYQDTYYAAGSAATAYGRAYFKNCFITGTVDYIFGRGVCVFDSCTTLTMSNSGTSITAPSAESTAKYGLVFRNCKLTADTQTYTDTCGYAHVPVTSFYLGRPWQSSPRAVYIQCNEPSTLAANGWTYMATSPTLFAEYNCNGAGAVNPRTDTTGYFRWSSSYWPRQLTNTEAATYSLATIFAKNSSSSTVITYDWMPTNATTNDNLPFTVTGVDRIASNLVPNKMTIGNYPNPFNPETNIQFTVAASGRATVKIYNILGQEVAHVFEGQALAGQSYKATFSGKRFASGVYFCSIESNGQRLVSRMLLLK
jgi:pectin methylesterase-like acyl-CoA thioesterase